MLKTQKKKDDTEVRPERRCRLDRGEGQKRGYAGFYYSDLLLRDERSDEDPAGQDEPALSFRIISSAKSICFPLQRKTKNTFRKKP